MQYQLDRINNKIKSDPRGFALDCDTAYNLKIAKAADEICDNIKISPIVLLSGPSGSGKTTTALKIVEELGNRGITSRAIAMDKYFKTIDPETAPRTPDGEIDFESPDCLDLELLDKHFTLLGEHKEIIVPHFDFALQARSESKFRPLHLGANEIAIFEGIHALSDRITDKHPEAFKLYVSAMSIIECGSIEVFSDTWMRLTRRIVRDQNFRGADAAFTLGLWDNILRGERLNILPFRDKADFNFDSSIPYEVSLMKQYALPLLTKVPEDMANFDKIQQIISAFSLFEDMDEELVSPSSLLREFIGGGTYKY